jgi:hypothetical protein
MVILRYVMIAISALYAFVLLMVWAFSSNSPGIGTIIPLGLVLANLFYVVMSRPSIRTSDFLVKTSQRFAHASMELQYLAQEAQSREVEAEKRRLAEMELHQYKMQAAREMLQHFRPKLSLEQLSEAKPQLITYLANTAKSAATALSPPPAMPGAVKTEGKVPPTNGHPVTPKAIPPVPPAPIAMPKAAPSASVLN